MRGRIVAAFAASLLAFAVPGAALAADPSDDGGEDAKPRTILYEGPNAVTIPYLDQIDAQAADGWRIEDCGSVRGQSDLVVACTDEGFTARADFYDPAYGHDVVDVRMTNGRVSTTMQYVLQLEPPEAPDTTMAAYPYPAPAGGSLLVPLSDLALECAACDEGGTVEAFSIAPAGAAELAVTETHVVIRPASSFDGELTVAVRFADQYDDWSQALEFSVPVSRLSDEAPLPLATYAEMPSEAAEFGIDALVAGDAEGVRIIGCGDAMHGSVSCGAGDVVRYAPASGTAVDQFSVHLMRGADVVTASVTLVSPDAETGLPTSGLVPLSSPAAEKTPKEELQAAQDAKAEADRQKAEEAAQQGQAPPADAEQLSEAETVGVRVATPLGPPPPAEGAASGGGIFTRFVELLDRMG